MESMKNLFILVCSKFNSLHRCAFCISSALLTGPLLTSCSSPLKYESRNNTSYTQNPSIKKTAQCSPYYTVVYGDTLSDIAEKCRVDMYSLARQNDLLPPYFIYVRQELSMPTIKLDKGKNVKLSPRSEIEVVKHSSVTAVSSTAKNKVVDRSAAPSIPRTSSKLTSSQWQWPMNSKLEHRFIRDSSGLSVLEIYGIPGQEIKTVAPGKVVYAGNGIINYGWMIVIKHDDGYMSIYAHNSALLVKEGARVNRGQKIAILGATGNTTKSKLYLEARYQGRKIDILKVLKK